MSRKGFFIVFEGIDGSGKSTQIELITMKLKQAGIDAIIEQEPTKNVIGKLIRDYAEAGDRFLSPEVEALLFSADRIEHSKRILSYLQQGVTVICDRFYHSTYAYQGASGIDIDWLKSLQKNVIKPDLVILLDIDPDSSLIRVSGRNLTIFENNSYLRKVREIYNYFAKNGELVKIDTLKPISEVEKDVQKQIEKLINTKLF